MNKLVLLLLGLSCCGIQLYGEEKAVTPVKVDATAAATAEKPVADPDNFFADPSLEKQRGRDFNGKVYFNFNGEYGYDDSGDYARTGKATVLLSGENYLIMEALGIKPGTTYVLSGWFKGAGKESGDTLRINWMKDGKFIDTVLFIGKIGSSAYEQVSLKAVAPPETTSAILYFHAEKAWLDDLSFAPAPVAK